MIDLNHLRELDAKATPGPWHEDDVRGMTWPTQIDGWSRPAQRARALERIDANAALIAAYRNATPALVSALTDVLALTHNMDERGKPGISDSLIDKASRRQIREDAKRIRRTLSAHLDLTNGAEQ